MSKRAKKWGAKAKAASVEAAEWLARIRGGQFDEVDFRNWIEADASHPAAFANVLEAWEIVGGLKSLYPEFAPEVAEPEPTEAKDTNGDPSDEIEESSNDEATMVSGSSDRGSG